MGVLHSIVFFIAIYRAWLHNFLSHAAVLFDFDMTIFGLDIEFSASLSVLPQP